MLSIEELNKIINSLETDRVEKTVSWDKRDKFGEAICAFSNDLPNHQKNGYLIIGVRDDNTIEGIKANDKEKDRSLQLLSDFGTDGRVTPRPSITIQVYNLDEKEIIVVEVSPSPHPPVRYNGNVYVRVGPRKAIASEADERILTEKRTAKARTFDALPCWDSSLEDLATDVIRLTYLPTAVHQDILRANHRDFKQQLASLRLYDLKHDLPTNAGILMFGLDPTYFIQGAYIQYVKVNGLERDFDNLAYSKEFKGALFDVLKEISDFLKYNIEEKKPVKQTDSFQMKYISNYPEFALRELVMNAIMHRDYESNSPIYIYEFADRIEIHNAGFLYGSVNRENFPNSTDYRNPYLAEIMRTLGYVERFGFGIQRVKHLLTENGSPAAEFTLTYETRMVVTLKKHTIWQSE
ncbi:MAG: RNA-binding domain-containing protein [Bacteroidia bacterium]